MNFRDVIERYTEEEIYILVILFHFEDHESLQLFTNFFESLNGDDCSLWSDLLGLYQIFISGDWSRLESEPSVFRTVFVRSTVPRILEEVHLRACANQWLQEKRPEITTDLILKAIAEEDSATAATACELIGYKFEQCHMTPGEFYTSICRQIQLDTTAFIKEHAELSRSHVYLRMCSLLHDRAKAKNPKYRGILILLPLIVANVEEFVFSEDVLALTDLIKACLEVDLAETLKTLRSSVLASTLLNHFHFAPIAAKLEISSLTVPTRSLSDNPGKHLGLYPRWRRDLNYPEPTVYNMFRSLD